MKTIAFALILMLTLAPVVFAEETSNPYSGEWEEGVEAGEAVQDPYGEQPQYHEPDYDPYRGQQDEHQLQDETWPDSQKDQWDQPQEGDQDQGSEVEEDRGDQIDPSMLPEEGPSDGYGDEGSQEQRQEEPWSYSPETGERRGPPPFLRIPSNRR